MSRESHRGHDFLSVVEVLRLLGLAASVLLCTIVVFRMLRCLSTPLLRRLGLYRYYSPRLMTMQASDGLQLHLGTSFDFLRSSDVSPRHSLRLLADGLLAICAAVERGDVPSSTVLTATTYFFREATLRRFGLRPHELGPLEWTLACTAWLELCLLQSLARRTIRLVRLERLLAVRFTAGDLVKQRRQIEVWRRALAPAS
jgi:hypothetical protein